MQLALAACRERRPGAKRKADREEVRQETVGERSASGQSASPQQAVAESKRRKRGPAASNFADTESDVSLQCGFCDELADPEAAAGEGWSVDLKLQILQCSECAVKHTEFCKKDHCLVCAETPRGVSLRCSSMECGFLLCRVCVIRIEGRTGVDRVKSAGGLCYRCDDTPLRARQEAAAGMEDRFQAFQANQKAFLSTMRQQRYRLVEVAANGNCFFLAVCDQLASNEYDPHSFNLGERRCSGRRPKFEEAAKCFRTKLVQWMRSHVLDGEYLTQEENTDYLNLMGRDKTWACERERIATARYLGAQLVVWMVTADGVRSQTYQPLADAVEGAPVLHLAVFGSHYWSLHRTGDTEVGTTTLNDTVSSVGTGTSATGSLALALVPSDADDSAHVQPDLPRRLCDASNLMSQIGEAPGGFNPGDAGDSDGTGGEPAEGGPRDEPGGIDAGTGVEEIGLSAGTHEAGIGSLISGAGGPLDEVPSGLHCARCTLVSPVGSLSCEACLHVFQGGTDMSGTGAGSQMGAKETGNESCLDSIAVPSVGSMGDLHCGRCTVINQAGSMSCETCAYVLISGTFFSRLLNGQSMDGSELYNFSLYLVAHSPKAGTTQLLPVHLPTVLGIGGRTRSMRSPWRTLPAAPIFLPGTDSAVGTVFMGEKDSVGHFIFVHLVLLPDGVTVRTMDSMRQVSGTLATGEQPSHYEDQLVQMVQKLLKLQHQGSGWDGELVHELLPLTAPQTGTRCPAYTMAVMSAVLEGGRTPASWQAVQTILRALQEDYSPRWGCYEGRLGCLDWELDRRLNRIRGHQPEEAAPSERLGQGRGKRRTTSARGSTRLDWAESEREEMGGEAWQAAGTRVGQRPEGGSAERGSTTMEAPTSKQQDKPMPRLLKPRWHNAWHSQRQEQRQAVRGTPQGTGLVEQGGLMVAEITASSQRQDQPLATGPPGDPISAQLRCESPDEMVQTAFGEVDPEQISGDACGRLGVAQEGALGEHELMSEAASEVLNEEGAEGTLVTHTAEGARRLGQDGAGMMVVRNGQAGQGGIHARERKAVICPTLQILAEAVEEQETVMQHGPGNQRTMCEEVSPTCEAGASPRRSGARIGGSARGEECGDGQEELQHTSAESRHPAGQASMQSDEATAYEEGGHGVLSEGGSLDDLQSGGSERGQGSCSPKEARTGHQQRSGSISRVVEDQDSVRGVVHSKVPGRTILALGQQATTHTMWRRLWVERKFPGCTITRASPREVQLGGLMPAVMGAVQDIRQRAECWIVLHVGAGGPHAGHLAALNEHRSRAAEAGYRVSRGYLLVATQRQVREQLRLWGLPDELAIPAAERLAMAKAAAATTNWVRASAGTWAEVGDFAAMIQDYEQWPGLEGVGSLRLGQGLDRVYVIDVRRACRRERSARYYFEGTPLKSSELLATLRRTNFGALGHLVQGGAILPSVADIMGWWWHRRAGLSRSPQRRADRFENHSDARRLPRRDDNAEGRGPGRVWRSEEGERREAHEDEREFSRAAARSNDGARDQDDPRTLVHADECGTAAGQKGERSGTALERDGDDWLEPTPTAPCFRPTESQLLEAQKFGGRSSATADLWSTGGRGMGAAMAHAIAARDAGMLWALLWVCDDKGRLLRYASLCRSGSATLPLVHRLVVRAIDIRKKDVFRADELIKIASILVSRGGDIDETHEQKGPPLWEMVQRLASVPEGWVSWALSWGADPYMRRLGWGPAYDYWKSDRELRRDFHRLVERYCIRKAPYKLLDPATMGLPECIEVREMGRVQELRCMHCVEQVLLPTIRAARLHVQDNHSRLLADRQTARASTSAQGPGLHARQHGTAFEHPGALGCSRAMGVNSGAVVSSTDSGEHRGEEGRWDQQARTGAGDMLARGEDTEGSTAHRREVGEGAPACQGPGACSRDDASPRSDFAGLVERGRRAGVQMNDESDQRMEGSYFNIRGGALREGGSIKAARMVCEVRRRRGAELGRWWAGHAPTQVHGQDSSGGRQSGQGTYSLCLGGGRLGRGRG